MISVFELVAEPLIIGRVNIDRRNIAGIEKWIPQCDNALRSPACWRRPNPIAK
jgi:hypothetical protein